MSSAFLTAGNRLTWRQTTVVIKADLSFPSSSLFSYSNEQTFTACQVQGFSLILAARRRWRRPPHRRLREHLQVRPQNNARRLRLYRSREGNLGTRKRSRHWTMTPPRCQSQLCCRTGIPRTETRQRLCPITTLFHNNKVPQPPMLHLQILCASIVNFGSQEPPHLTQESDSPLSLLSCRRLSS